MGKFFLILFVILLIVLGGFVFFVLTFDVDQFRPRIQSELSANLEMPVAIGRIGLGWQGGVALEVRDVEIGSAQKEFSVRVQGISGILQVMPLLQRQIRIGSIVIDKPEVTIRSGAGNGAGGTNVSSPKPSGNKAGDKESISPAAMGMAFLVSSVRVRNGRIQIDQPAANGGNPITVEDIGIDIENLTLNGTIEVSGKARVLSNRQNVMLKADVLVSSREFAVRSNNASIDLDLSTIRPERIAEMIPDLKFSKGDGLGGTLQVDLTELEFHPRDGLRSLGGGIRLKDGAVELQGYAASNVNGAATFGLNRIDLEQLKAEFAGGQLVSSGSVNGWMKSPDVELRMTFKNGLISELIPPVASGQPKPEGIFTLSFQGRSPAPDWNRVVDFVSGQGQFALKDGVIRNLNIIREVFNGISIIPGLLNKLQEGLPPEYQEKLKERDTYFEPINIPFSVQNNTVTVPDIQVVSDTFMVLGSGVADFSGQVKGSATVYLDPPLSSAVVRTVREFQYLMDSQGRIGIPMLIQGRNPNIRVWPNLQFLTQRLAVSKTSEILSGFLKKDEPAKDPQTVAAPPTATQGGQGAQTATPQTQDNEPQDLLGLLLQKALEKTK